MVNLSPTPTSTVLSLLKAAPLKPINMKRCRCVRCSRHNAAYSGESVPQRRQQILGRSGKRWSGRPCRTPRGWSNPRRHRARGTRSRRGGGFQKRTAPRSDHPGHRPARGTRASSSSSELRRQAISGPTPVRNRRNNPMGMLTRLKNGASTLILSPVTASEITGNSVPQRTRNNWPAGSGC